MPVTTIGSYISTAQDIIAHWTDVNADRIAAGGTELLLTGGYSLADFIADVNALQAAIDAIIGLENANVLASGDRDAQKDNLLDRLRQFRAALKLHFKGTAYANAAPRVPRATASQSKFTRAMTDMSDLWQRLDASGGIGGFTPPLLLRGGYTQAGLDTDIASLRTAYQEVDHAQNDLELARKQRDQLLDPLRQRMLQYRAAIQLEYGEGHPFTQSLPDVSPGSGGGTVLTTFPYDRVQSEPGTVLIWFRMPGGLTDVFTLFAKEGAAMLSFQVDAVPPGQTVQATWTNVTLDGEVDEVTLRDSQGNDIATGVRDETLPNPGP